MATRRLYDEDKCSHRSVHDRNAYALMFYALVCFGFILFNLARSCGSCCGRLRELCASLCSRRSAVDAAGYPVVDSSLIRILALLIYVLPIVALAYLLQGIDKPSGDGTINGEIAGLVTMAASPLIDLYVALRFYCHWFNPAVHDATVDLKAPGGGLRLARNADETIEVKTIQFSQVDMQKLRAASCCDRFVLWIFALSFAVPLSLVGDFIHWGLDTQWSKMEVAVSFALKLASALCVIYTPELISSKVFERYLVPNSASFHAVEHECLECLCANCRRPLCTVCYMGFGCCLCDPDVNVGDSYRFWAVLSYVFGGAGAIFGLVLGGIAAMILTTSCSWGDMTRLNFLIWGAIIGCTYGCYSAFYNGTRYDAPRYDRSTVCLASCSTEYVLLSYRALPEETPGCVGTLLGLEHGHNCHGYLMLPVKGAKGLVNTLLAGPDGVEGIAAETEHQEDYPDYKENPMNAVHGQHHKAHHHEPRGAPSEEHHLHHAPMGAPPGKTGYHETHHHHAPMGPPPEETRHHAAHHHAPMGPPPAEDELPNRTELVQSPGSEEGQNWDNYQQQQEHDQGSGYVQGEDGQWYYYDANTGQYYNTDDAVGGTNM